MAKKYKNSKGFLIIQMSLMEAFTTCEFGDICDNCNDVINVNEECYYVAVLNRLFCKNCLLNFVNNTTRHKEDINYEKKHYNFYATKLGLELET